MIWARGFLTLFQFLVMKHHRLPSTIVKRAFCSPGTACIRDGFTWKTRLHLREAFSGWLTSLAGKLSPIFLGITLSRRARRIWTIPLERFTNLMNTHWSWAAPTFWS